MTGRPNQIEWESMISVAEMGGAPETDLHGKDAVGAAMETERFLGEAFRQGHPVVKIVHGRGTGVLQETTRRLLAQHPLVAYARPSDVPSELGAVMYAVIAKSV